jgi:hypothetical protein
MNRSPYVLRPVIIFLMLAAAAFGDEPRPAMFLPDLPDLEIVRAYERAAVQNVLAAINDKIFSGYWSVCADDQRLTLIFFLIRSPTTD